MTSGELKMVGLQWLRYVRQMTYVATEAGSLRADIFGADSKQAIEIEVKVSRYDLINELRHKPHKHMVLQEGRPNSWTPNRFYFLVPNTLAAEAISLVEEKAPLYGVLSCSADEEGRLAQVPFKRVTVPRSAKMLKKEPPTKAFLEHIAHRMASEICGFHLLRDRYGRLFDEVRSTVQKMHEEAYNFVEEQG